MPTITSAPGNRCSSNRCQYQRKTLPQLAGYAQDVSIEDISQRLSQRLTDLRGLKCRLEEKKNQAIGEASAWSSEAEAAMTQATNKRKALPDSESEAYAVELNELAGITRDAEYLSTQARAAAQTASDMHAYAQQVDAQIEEAEAQIALFETV